MSTITIHSTLGGVYLSVHQSSLEQTGILSRLKRIREESGVGVILRIVLLLGGFLVMSIAGIVFLSSYTPAVISLLGLLLGYLLRDKIAQRAELLPAVKLSLLLYGVVLALGDLLDMGKITKLSIITVATVLVFVLQFWCLSDPLVYRWRMTQPRMDNRSSGLEQRID